MSVSFNISESSINRHASGQTLHIAMTGGTSTLTTDWTIAVGTWSGVVTYLAGAGEWPEVICAENLNEVPGLPAKPPLATQPDF